MIALRSLDRTSELDADLAPPEAPLEMPLQVLEWPEREGRMRALRRLLSGLRPGRAE